MNKHMYNKQTKLLSEDLEQHIKGTHAFVRELSHIQNEYFESIHTALCEELLDEPNSSYEDRLLDWLHDYIFNTDTDLTFEEYLRELGQGDVLRIAQSEDDDDDDEDFRVTYVTRDYSHPYATRIWTGPPMESADGYWGFPDIAESPHQFVEVSSELFNLEPGECRTMTMGESIV